GFPRYRAQRKRAPADGSMGHTVVGSAPYPTQGMGGALAALSPAHRRPRHSPLFRRTATHRTAAAAGTRSGKRRDGGIGSARCRYRGWLSWIRVDSAAGILSAID